MEQCSFLVSNGTRSDADAPRTDGDRVDVLPPFAGGQDERTLRRSPAAIPPTLPEYARVLRRRAGLSWPAGSSQPPRACAQGLALERDEHASPAALYRRYGRPRRELWSGPIPCSVPSDVLLTREDPPFSGPAAAIHAGLERVAAQCEGSGTPTPKWCLILGVDTPRIAPARAAD